MARLKANNKPLQLHNKLTLSHLKRVLLATVVNLWSNLKYLMKKGDLTFQKQIMET